MTEKRNVPFSFCDLPGHAGTGQDTSQAVLARLKAVLARGHWRLVARVTEGSRPSNMRVYLDSLVLGSRGGRLTTGLSRRSGGME